MNRKRAMTLGMLLGLALLPLFSGAEELKLDETPIPTDQATVQRGAEEVIRVCSGCHGLKYIHYRDLLTLGFSKDKVDKWRGTNPMGAPMKPQMPPSAAKASFGVVPPDLSLMAGAREGRGHYIYTYLTGYHMVNGKLTNSVFPVTRMPDILGLSLIKDPQQRAKTEKTAMDVTAFLVWAADPHAQQRRHMGYYVLGFVFVMTVLLYLWKKQIWKEIDSRPKIK